MSKANRNPVCLIRRNWHEEAFSLRRGSMRFCCPDEYCSRAIGLRWFMGPCVRDATRRMRSCLQFYCQCFERGCDAPQPREVQRVRREIRCGARFGNRTGQIRRRLRQTLQQLWSRDMERACRKCAMLGLLDRATKLMLSQGDKAGGLPHRSRQDTEIVSRVSSGSLPPWSSRPPPPIWPPSVRR
jgi:hypothetical protein